MKKNNDLVEKRIFKVKNPSLRFFCPLCSTERFVCCHPKLTWKNYMHISLITIILVLMLYPWMELRSLFVFFIVWGMMEMTKRLLFKKQLPCPHCGFDASWYKKDAGIARQLMKDFWKDRLPSKMPFNEVPPKKHEATSPPPPPS